MARIPKAVVVEALPEADRLEEFAHPRHTLKLFGHDETEADLVSAFATGHMHHAWLMTGPKGIGKATLAYRLARYVLAPPIERVAAGSNLNVVSDGVAAAQVAALSHPGLLLIRRPYDIKAKRFAASIPVDEVRRLRGFLAHKAATNSWRVVIVDSADEMNANAANALLKSLEEPPSRVLFLLISSEPGRLLPTIRSRCRRLDIAPLDSDPLRRAALQALKAAEKGHEDAGLAQLEPLAGGSVRQLLILSASDGLKLHERVRSLLTKLPRVDWPEVHSMADELASIAAAQKFETFFSLLMGQISRAVRAGATGEGQREDLDTAVRLFGGAGDGATGDPRLATWAGLWETMAREKAQTLALNLDRKGLILDCVARLEQLAKQQH